MSYRDHLQPEPTCLYGFHDSQDRFLYVGITMHFYNRMKYHARRQRWWSEVARTETFWFPNRPEAAFAEKAFMILDRPRYNVAGNELRADLYAYGGSHWRTLDHELEQFCIPASSRNEYGRLRALAEEKYRDGCRAFSVNDQRGETVARSWIRFFSKRAAALGELTSGEFEDLVFHS